MVFRFGADFEARRAANRAYERQRQAEARAMSNETLIASARYCLSQMPEARRWTGGDCVYNGQFYHILFPELLRRLGCLDDENTKARRIYIEAANGEEK